MPISEIISDHFVNEIHLQKIVTVFSVPEHRSAVFYDPNPQKFPASGRTPPFYSYFVKESLISLRSGKTPPPLGGVWVDLVQTLSQVP